MTQETPRPIIESVVHATRSANVAQLVRITSGGRHETYRAECDDGIAVVVRIARCGTPWFVDEERLMARAAEVGARVPEVLGVEHVEHAGELLSFSVLGLLPGRSLAELAGKLPANEIERLVERCGELLGRIHCLSTDHGMTHELLAHDEEAIARAMATARESGGASAGGAVRRGADYLRELIEARDTPATAFTHGDFLPKHLLVERGEIVGLIDWEFAGSAPPAFDLARWEVAAGAPLHLQTEALRAGYRRVADPDAASDGWIPAFAVDHALTVLSWKSPASPARIHRCLETLDRYS